MIKYQLQLLCAEVEERICYCKTDLEHADTVGILVNG